MTKRWIKLTNKGCQRQVYVQAGSLIQQPSVELYVTQYESACEFISPYIIIFLTVILTTIINYNTNFDIIFKWAAGHFGGCLMG